MGNNKSIKKYFIAIRAFSMPASVMPVIFGTLMAVFIGDASFRLLPAILAVVGMAVLHSGANVLNDVKDFQKGLDKEVTPVSGAVVRGLMTPGEALRYAIILLTTGCIIGLYLVSISDISLLYIGVFGVFIGIVYTVGPFALKYYALGDFAVFVNFGILGSLGAWIVQGLSFSWLPIIWTVPLSLLVIGILHANNWRDKTSDTEGNIITIASLMSDRAALIYFGFLLFSPFIIISILVGVKHGTDSMYGMPVAFLIILLAVPMAVKLFFKAKNRKTASNPMDFVTLDGATAQLNMLFGILCSIAVILSVFTG